MHVNRRALLVAAAAAGSAAAARRVLAAGPTPGVASAVERFAALPATASCLVAADHPTAPWRAAHDPAARLFVGSAVKTFILAQYLREVEAGRLSESTQM